MRRTTTAVLFAAATAVLAQSQPSKPVSQPQHENNQGNGAARSAEPIGEHRSDPVNPHLAQSPPQDKGLLVEEKQVHADGRQGPGAPEQNPGNQGQPKPKDEQQDGRLDWISWENWPAILALLANIPTWLIAIRYGRRQARAAEDANVISREALAAQDRPDARWSSLTVVFSSIYDGDNTFRATLSNYGRQPITVCSASCTATIAGTAVPCSIQTDLNGILVSGGSMDAVIEVTLDVPAGTDVHSGIAELTVSCAADYIATNGAACNASATFTFDRSAYAFRLSPEQHASRDQRQ